MSLAYERREGQPRRQQLWEDTPVRRVRRLRHHINEARAVASTDPALLRRFEPALARTNTDAEALEDLLMDDQSDQDIERFGRLSSGDGEGYARKVIAAVLFYAVLVLALAVIFGASTLLGTSWPR